MTTREEFEELVRLFKEQLEIVTVEQIMTAWDELVAENDKLKAKIAELETELAL